jgi:Flp pilus assembly pilin Flp
MLVLRLLISRFFTETQAQDLTEYSLVIAAMAFAAVAGMQSLSSGISATFTTVSSDLGTSL